MATEELLHYEPPTHRFRVLFSDGEVVDVLAYQDNSHMRSWVLAQQYGPNVPKGKSIAAVVMMDAIERGEDEAQRGGDTPLNEVVPTRETER